MLNIVDRKVTGDTELTVNALPLTVIMEIDVTMRELVTELQERITYSRN